MDRLAPLSLERQPHVPPLPRRPTGRQSLAPRRPLRLAARLVVWRKASAVQCFRMLYDVVICDSGPRCDAAAVHLRNS
jgi:hypothetical protein